MHLLHRTADKLWLEREKSEAMFSELQHRVANNMQLVASVLQLERTTDRSKAESLAAAQRRLELLSAIHRRLYDPAASSQPVTTHLASLCDELVRAEGRNDLAIEVQPSALMLGPERLIILSLLVVEIVTNSLKHAFKDDGGRIDVRINSISDPCELTVSDNGSGMPPGRRRSAAPLAAASSTASRRTFAAMSTYVVGRRHHGEGHVRARMTPQPKPAAGSR